MILKLAWRNIGRNKKRTLITASSIFFAVIFSVFMISIQNGGWGRMIDNVINYYIGYAQIHQKGYQEAPSINKLIYYTKEIKLVSNKIDHLKQLVPRLESFALAAINNQTKGVLLCGIDPEMENEMTHLKERIVEGEYLVNDDHGVLVAKGLADLLKLTIGDSLVMISQGYHGVNAVGKYPIRGIVYFAPPDLNKRMVYINLTEAQYFFGASNKVSSLILHIDDKKHLADISDRITQLLDFEEHELIQWEKLIPGLLDAMQTKLNGVYMIMIILYVIISFGIFGTILMMMKEREYEFGIMIGIGMRRRILAWTIWVEITLLGLVGSIMGILGSIPLIYYFKVNPIDMSKAGEDLTKIYEDFGVEPIFPTSFEWQVFLQQAIIVFLITSILASYTFLKINAIKIVEAMKN